MDHPTSPRVRIAHAVAALVAGLLALDAAHAAIPASQAVRRCETAAVRMKGLVGYRAAEVRVDRGPGGGHEVRGRLVRGVDRREFGCRVAPNGVARNVYVSGPSIGPGPRPPMPEVPPPPPIRPPVGAAARAMQARCEAAVQRRYGVSPPQIRIGPVTIERGGYEVRGTIDSRLHPGHTFACEFDRQRHFRRLVPITR